MKKTSLFLLIAISFFSCKENNEQPPFDNNTFYKNHQAANWTKESAKEHLQGRWELIYVYCCGFGESNEWSAIDNGYYDLLFEGDSVTVYKENNLETKQSWDFEDRSGNLFYLETEENIQNTFGTMYFSEDYLLFNGSPMDVSDNYFKKVE
jgi:hypothetical protein